MTTAETMFAQPGDGMMDRKQEARKILWAFLAALFVHLVVAYSLATWGGIFSPTLPVSGENETIVGTVGPVGGPGITGSSE